MTVMPPRKQLGLAEGGAALPREARAAIAAMALCQVYMGVEAGHAVRRAQSIVEGKLRAQADDPLARLDAALRDARLLRDDESAAELVDMTGEAKLPLA